MIISGGQTGGGQAALDVAIELGVPHGGWIPKGLLTEKGHLSVVYRLKKMPTASYSKRFEQNILVSDDKLMIGVVGPVGNVRKWLTQSSFGSSKN